MILLYVSTFERVEKEPRTIAFYQICADKNVSILLISSWKNTPIKNRYFKSIYYQPLDIKQNNEYVVFMPKQLFKSLNFSQDVTYSPWWARRMNVLN